MKRLGFSDRQLADLRGITEAEIRALRHRLGIRPAYKMVDTCAGEFPSATPYLYSSYDEENEARGLGRPDGGDPRQRPQPDRAGGGVRLPLRPRRDGVPGDGIPHRDGELQPGDGLHRLRHLRRALLRAAHAGGRAGDRPRRAAARRRGPARRADAAPAGAGAGAGGRAHPGHVARGDRPGGGPRAASRRSPASSAWPSRRAASPTRWTRRSRWPGGSGYPVLVRPSYVLGGRAMEIVYDDASLRSYFARAARVAPEHPVLIDSFLEDAFEADVDAIADGTRCVIGGVMQHIEDAGIHSGDSACVLPPYLITEAQVEEMRGIHPRLRRAAGRGRADQRAVRHQERRGVRAGGESARLAHRAVRLQDHRRAAGQARRGGDGGTDARRARAPGRRAPALRRGEGGGVPLQQARRRGPRARPGDALHRRGHGDRRLLRDGVRQGADLGRRRAAARGRRSSSR